MKDFRKAGDVLQKLCAKERANTPFDHLTVEEITSMVGCPAAVDYPSKIDYTAVPFAPDDPVKPRPIATRYGPRHYRSRLEARWACFFDEMKLTYEYEPEGFELPDGSRYLPDFWLPDYGWFVEVKPTISGLASKNRKSIRFSRDMKSNLLVLDGEPAYRAYIGFSTFVVDGRTSFDYTPYSLDVYYFRTVDKRRFWSLPDYSGMRLAGPDESSMFSAEYISAVHAALSARFEAA